MGLERSYSILTLHGFHQDHPNIVMETPPPASSEIPALASTTKLFFLHKQGSKPDMYVTPVHQNKNKWKETKKKFFKTSPGEDIKQNNILEVSTTLK